MNKIIETILIEYAIPSIVALSAGAGFGLLARRKKIHDIIDAKEKPRKKENDDLLLEKKVFRQMGVVNGVLNVLWKVMKKDYADLVFKKYNIDIISDKKCD